MITVIVPIYNSAKTLSDCINSIISQSYTNLEIILVNDGSTDDSLKLCEEFKLVDDRIVVINKKNEGAAKARNDGLRIARGNYVAFVDSDDFINKDMYGYMRSLAEKHDADIVQCGHEKVGINGEILYRSSYNNSIISDKRECFLQYCQQTNIDNYSPTKIYRKDIIKDIFFGHLSYSEDAVFIMQAFLNCSTLVVTDRLFYKYVQTPNSMCRRPFSRFYLDTITAGKFMYDKCNAVYPEYSSFFALYIAKWARYCYCETYMTDKDLSLELWRVFKEYFRKISPVKHISALYFSIVFFRYLREIYLRLKESKI